MLSSRVLHFAAHEMVFECNSAIDCECKNNHDKYGDLNRGFKKEFLEEHGCYWKYVVQNYSSSDLTRLTDILVALSGVAKMYALKHRETYLAGLWLEDLPQAVLWYSVDGPGPRTPSYTAPSFSWASRAVQYGNSRTKVGKTFSPCSMASVM